MSRLESSPARLEPEPLPDNLRSVQPGGGNCYRLELAWGRWRRWWLRTFQPGYVRRMAELRVGSTDGAPHEILDPRDLKYCRNQCDCSWPPEADLFAWRDRLPLARWGLAEVQLMGYPLAALAVGLGWWHWWLAIVPLVLLAFVLYFFRDPPRRVPNEPGLLVSPADGKVVEIARIEHDAFIGGPAVRIGIFLSIFNVHINRPRPPRGSFASAIIRANTSMPSTPTVPCATRRCGLAWRKRPRPTAGSSCGRWPA